MAHFSFDSYLKQHKIKLSPKAHAFCKLGLKRMAKSVDPIHNHLHVVCLLNNFAGLLKNERSLLKQDLDYNALLISIIWHDIWKSARFPKGLFKLAWDQIYEGRGSAKIVAREMKKADFPKQTIKKVAYAIRQHSIVHRKRKTIESKILKDVDELARWNVGRIKFAGRQLFGRKILSSKLLKAGKFYVNWFMRPAHTKLYFGWSRREFRQLKKAWLKQAGTLYKKYEKIVGVNSRTSARNFSIP